MLNNDCDSKNMYCKEGNCVGKLKMFNIRRETRICIFVEALNITQLCIFKFQSKSIRVLMPSAAYLSTAIQ